MTIEVTREEFGELAIVPTVNIMQRAHWSKKTAQRDAYILIFSIIKYREKIKSAQRGQKFKMVITSYRPRLMDTDNLYGAHKWMIDALCLEIGKDKNGNIKHGSKIIYDDDPEHLDLTVKQVKATKKTKEKIKTLIEIDAIEFID